MSIDRDAPSPLAAEAAAGVTDPALAALLVDHLEWLLRWHPTLATRLGDHRYDDRVERRDAASIRRFHDERGNFIGRVGQLDAGGLDPDDQLTWMLLMQALGAMGAADLCRFQEWAVSSRGGLLDEISYVVEMHPLTTPADGDNLLARMAEMARWPDVEIANLRVGLRKGRIASREVVRRAVAQLDAELARPTSAWAMTAPARDERPGWPEIARGRFAAALGHLVDDEVRPGLVRLRAFLADEVLPRGRTGADEGIHAVRGGDMGYQALIVAYLGAAHAPADLHALGLAEIARSDAAIAELGGRLFGAADLAATIAHLRTDRGLYFGSRDELLGAAEAALARARAAIPRWFGRLPKAPCEVREIPEHEAPYTYVAYYRPPHFDGSRPGEYYVNTYRPEVRTRYELEALTWHEAIPGHHLQIAIAQELGPTLPLFRRIDGSTAYVEGWALYTERLADEMGLYSGDLDRLGMHSFDAWRAARLVVDTGLHAMGWTRAQAEAFMLEHTALTPENVSNEVDRYITDPGQALAYKVGQLAMLDVRRQAEAALGDRFDVRGFHDVVLGVGAVTLPALQIVIGRWLSEQGAGGAAAPHDHDHDH